MSAAVLPARPVPTMADVAERAGVSTMTVSRALRDGGVVSDATRRRIMQAVDELGYTLDRSAGTLSSKRSGFIAAIVPTINNSNFSDTTRGLTDAVEGHGLQVLLGYSDYVIEKEARLIEAMLRRRPEGLILTGGPHTARSRKLLGASGIPVVETWDLPLDPLGHVVGFCNAASVRALVVKLHARGYREIGFIGGTSARDSRGFHRRRGYVQAVADCGLPQGRVLSLGEPPISMEQGGRAMAQLMERWPSLDAVVCVSDLSAFGAIMECHRRGWAVPGRIAVAGFGDFEVGRFTYPRLTTVGVDAYRIGREAGEILLRSITARQEGRPVPRESQEVPFEIMEREST